MATQLGRELQTYEARRAELLARGENKFVLIKDELVVGLFDSQMEAIHEGYRRLGNVAFLVRQVVRVDVVLHLRSHLTAA